jgi:hypothetical protein
MGLELGLSRVYHFRHDITLDSITLDRFYCSLSLFIVLIIVTLFRYNATMFCYLKRKIYQSANLFEFEIFLRLVDRWRIKVLFIDSFPILNLKVFSLNSSILNLLMWCKKIFDINTNNKCKYCKNLCHPWLLKLILSTLDANKRIILNARIVIGAQQQQHISLYCIALKVHKTKFINHRIYFS